MRFQSRKRRRRRRRRSKSFRRPICSYFLGLIIWHYILLPPIKTWVFHYARILSCINVYGLCKILFLFNLIFKFFFQQFNINCFFFLKMWDWNKMGKNKKDVKYWFLNFKNHAKYTISVPQIFFQFNFDTKVYFCYFLVPDWERREGGLWILTVEIEKYC